mmetsp:Transcript_211/g.421  ORF Transcript_211/g.421 Transcript_211/m.421 type:complete len:206 (+) Transcript_211:70-687(+)
MTLFDLLPEAVAKPSTISPQDDGAALVSLAMHCLMVKGGFVSTKGGKGRKRFVPPEDWNARKNEWVLEYSRKDSGAAKFIMHASVVNGKMFVKAMQVGEEKNSHVLGVQVEIYVRSLEGCKSSNWAEAMDNLDRLQEMFEVYVARPLAASVVPVAPAAPAPGGSSGGGELPDATALLEILMENKYAVAAGLVAVLVAAGFLARRR